MNVTSVVNDLRTKSQNLKLKKKMNLPSSFELPPSILKFLENKILKKEEIGMSSNQVIYTEDYSVFIKIESNNEGNG